MRKQQAAGQQSGHSTRLFEIGRYWLGLESGSDVYYYYWYEPADKKAGRSKGRTRHKATGKRVLDEAKDWLVKLHLKEAPDVPHRRLEDVTLVAIRDWYFEHHGRHIRSEETARRSFQLIIEYLKGQRKKSGPITADEFTLASQEAFMRWAATVHDLSAKSISTYLTYYRAAIRFAAKPRMVADGRGEVRESRILDAAPHVETKEAVISKLTNKPMSAPRDFVPTDQDLARVLDAINEPHILRYCILALNLWARPEAILELRVSKQVDFERGLVKLNPDDRRQNTKVRPTVRLTQNLRDWLIYWNADAPVCRWTRDGRCLVIVDVGNRALKAAAIRAGVPNPEKYNKYVLRHYMATRIRSVEGIHVPREQRAEWMGHTDPDHRTTQAWYESLDPDHLKEACEATDAIMVRLSGLARRSLIAPKPTKARYKVVENDKPAQGSKNAASQ